MFVAYEVALDLIRLVRRVIASIGTRDRDLADQMRRAATSAALNLAEGRERRGADRVRCYRIAAGSAAEVRAALDVALAWGFAETAELAEARACADRVVRIVAALAR